MIRISEITLCESAVWINEVAYGLPKSERVLCADGSELIYTDSTENLLEIYVPKVSGELKRTDMTALKALAESSLSVSAEVNGRQMQVLITALELKPIRPAQQQTDNDSYYGYIKLLEV